MNKMIKRKTNRNNLETTNSAKRYRALFEQAADSIVVIDAKTGAVVEFNDRAHKILGYTRQEFKKLKIKDFEVLENEEAVKRHLMKIVKNGSGIFETRHRRKAGDIKDIMVNAKAIKINGREYIQAIWHDITQQKKTERALRESETRYKTLLKNIPQRIFYKDLNSVYLLCNESLAEDLGIKPEDIRGKTDYDFFDKKLAAKYRSDDKRIMRTGELDKIEEHYIKDGKDFTVRTFKAPVRDENGGIIGIFGIFWDITESKKSEKKLGIMYKKLTDSNKKLRHLVVIDPQTGLYNYIYLQEILEAEFNRAKRSVQPLSFIMLDIDYFKSINDVYGHHFGDLVLKQFAKQLKKIVRQYDIVARFGGEEFAVISPDTDHPGALKLAQRLLDALNLYNFGNKKHTVKLKLSAVVCSYPEDNINKAADFFELADKILDKAKEYGGNRICTCSDLVKKTDQAAKKIDDNSEDKTLKERIDKLTRQASQSLIEAIFAFAKTIEMKDHYTGEHVERTVWYATQIAEALQLSSEEVERVKKAAILHDLGKVGISEKILHKKSKLNSKEFKEIKRHPQIAIDIIRPIHFLHDIIPLILHHHEWWNGKGYPSELKGEEIPVGARIVSIADAYQALTSNRPYRKSYSSREALRIIKNESGIKFDPMVVSVFLKILQTKEQPSENIGK